jgi:CDGSH-type Zn-finger protein/uncharacterized Fe-S cluster protein YjdI
MSDPHVFPDPKITVTWSKRRCIHSAECVAGLPMVFEPGRKPWITPEDAPANAIARVIERCPTGALHYQRHDGGAAETPDAEASVRPSRHGPLHLRGDLRVAIGEGAVLRDVRVALCRCGRSRNAPFCDGSHHAAGFRDAGEVFEARIGAPEVPPGPLRVTARENGPLRLEGAFTIVSADGRVKLAAGEAALCRCGQSRNRPFCDSSHKTSGFVAPALEIAEDAAGT